MSQLFKRSTTAVLALTLLVSACGTGTESSSSERTRNNALGVSSCVPATAAGQKLTSEAQNNVDKLAKTLASKKKAFNKAQKAFAKERKRKPAPRKPLLKSLYKKSKTTGNAWRKAELLHSLALRGLASKLASQNCTPQQVVQTVSNEIAQVGPAPTVVPELSSGAVAKDGLESSTPSEVTTTTVTPTSTAVASPAPTSTAVAAPAPTSTAVVPTTSTTTSTTSTTTTTTTQAPKPTTTTSTTPVTTTTKAPTTTTTLPAPTFSDEWLYDYGVFNEVAMSASGRTTALLDFSQLTVRSGTPTTTYRHNIDDGNSVAVSPDGNRVGVGTGTGKLILSDNGGASFYPAISLAPYATVMSLAITDNTDCFGMYVASVEGLYSGLFCPSKGVLVGKWRNISPLVYFEVKSSADGQYAIALPLSTDQAIVTKNYGSTWTKVGGTAFFASSWMSNNGQNILISEYGRMSVSKDYGATWKVLLEDQNYDPGYYHGIAASNDLTVIYAAERDSTILRRSTNSGASWLSWKVDRNYFDNATYSNMNIAASATGDKAVLAATYEFAPVYAFYIYAQLANA